MERLNQLLGGEGTRIAAVFGALLVVIVLIVLVSWLIRKLGGVKTVAPAKRSDRTAARLAVVDAAHVDGQRRLVLVRRDDVEHLVMIGGPNDVLIEPRIVRGQPQGGQRMAPQQMQPAPMQVPQAPPQGAPQTRQPQPAPVAMAAPQPQVPIPPPFIEPVTSPAISSGRGSFVAADLRAAIGEPRLPEMQPRQAPQQRDLAPPPSYADEDNGMTRMAPPRHAPEPAYDDATVPMNYGQDRGAPRGMPQAAQMPMQSYAPEPQPVSLEDMIAGGLEEAMLRVEPPAPPRAQPAPRMAPSQGPRSNATYDQRQALDQRQAQKDAIANDIERAIHDLTTNAPPPPQPAPREREMFRSEPRPQRAEAPRMAPPEMPQRQRMAATPQQPPQAPRGSMPNVNARPFLVQPQEPTVAVMPSADNVRNDAKRSSAEIEDEMARLLSELTGTTQR